MVDIVDNLENDQKPLNVYNKMEVSGLGSMHLHVKTGRSYWPYKSVY